MQFYEYYNALENLKVQEGLVKRCRRHGLKFKKEFQKLLELVITVNGHAWCMDIASERRKMSRLVTAEFMKYIQLDNKRV